MTPKHLGQASSLPASPEEAVLDYVAPAPRPALSGPLHRARIHLALPVTGQPDFAHLVIDYVPAETIVESKSLKLFLSSFRNHAAFHEDCTVGIGERLTAEMKPQWLRIGGYWYPRAGFRSMSSGNLGRCPRVCGCPTKVCRAIAAGADLPAINTGQREFFVAMQHKRNHIPFNPFRERESGNNARKLLVKGSQWRRRLYCPVPNASR